MFVDACVIVSILTREPSAATYRQALNASNTPFTSALAAWEAIIILAKPDRLNCSYGAAETAVVLWLEDNRIALRDDHVPRKVLSFAVEVAERYGLGKRALSNFDCFHYAHAKAAGVPLLTLDRLLRETDVETLPSEETC